MTLKNKFIIKDIVMVGLALLSIFLVIFEVVGLVNSYERQWVTYLDIIVACIFLLDFSIAFFHAEQKSHFIKKYWWELVAAIPISSTTTQALRGLKLLEFIPILESVRFLRLATRLRIILLFSKKYTKQTVLVYIMILLISIILLGAIGFYHYEFGFNDRVKSFNDSLYWATITTATVGYGDIYPVTEGGRFIAILLIFSGVGTIGAFITVIESFILRKNV